MALCPASFLLEVSMEPDKLFCKFKFPLGAIAKSSLSGTEGKIKGRLEQLYGPMSYWISLPPDKNGTRQPDVWFDEGEIM